LIGEGARRKDKGSRLKAQGSSKFEEKSSQIKEEGSWAGLSTPTPSSHHLDTFNSPYSLLLTCALSLAP